MRKLFKPTAMILGTITGILAGRNLYWAGIFIIFTVTLLVVYERGYSQGWHAHYNTIKPSIEKVISSSDKVSEHHKKLLVDYKVLIDERDVRRQLRKIRKS